jgi:hypothetical protein
MFGNLFGKDRAKDPDPLEVSFLLRGDVAEAACFLYDKSNSGGALDHYKMAQFLRALTPSPDLFSSIWFRLHEAEPRLCARVKPGREVEAQALAAGIVFIDEGNHRICPHCGSAGSIRKIGGWTAKSTLETGNETTLTEYQCHSKVCGGKSFWL